jgi:hypothetical protein
MPGVSKVEASMLVKSRHGTIGPMPITHELNITEWVGPFTTTVPTSTTEEAIVAIGTQGLTTVTACLFTATHAVSITYGVAANNVPIDLAAGGVHLLSGCSLTAISISNSSGSSASVTYFLAGA